MNPAGAVVASDVVLIEVRGDFGVPPRHFALELAPTSGVMRPAAADEVTEFEGYLAACARGSVSAFERLQHAPGGLKPPQAARRFLRVTPSPDGSRATVIEVPPVVARVVDVDSASELHLAGVEGVRLIEPLAWCRDGRRLAVCECEPGAMATTKGIWILDTESGEVLSRIAVTPQVQDIAWSEDGSRIAVLVTDLVSAGGLVDAVGAALGHGRPHFELRVLVMDTEGAELGTHVVASDIAYGTGTIVWDREAVTCLADEAMGGRVGTGVASTR